MAKLSANGNEIARLTRIKANGTVDYISIRDNGRALINMKYTDGGKTGWKHWFKNLTGKTNHDWALELSGWLKACNGYFETKGGK